MRFPILRSIMRYKRSNCADIIFLCAVLHTFLIDTGAGHLVRIDPELRLNLDKVDFDNMAEDAGEQEVHSTRDTLLQMC